MSHVMSDHVDVHIRCDHGSPCVAGVARGVKTSDEALLPEGLIHDVDQVIRHGEQRTGSCCR